MYIYFAPVPLLAHFQSIIVLVTVFRLKKGVISLFESTTVDVRWLSYRLLPECFLISCWMVFGTNLTASFYYRISMHCVLWCNKKSTIESILEVLMWMTVWQVGEGDYIRIPAQWRTQHVITWFPAVQFRRLSKMSSDFDWFDNTRQWFTYLQLCVKYEQGWR